MEVKKIIIIILISLIGLKAYNQTVIPQTTTVYSFSSLGNGVYRIITATDTVDLTKDSAVKIHDTIKILVPCPKVDTAAIQALKICTICPAPIVCPACPPIPKQRTVVGITLDLITNKKTFTYDDGTTTTL